MNRPWQSEVGFSYFAIHILFIIYMYYSLCRFVLCQINRTCKDCSTRSHYKLLIRVSIVQQWVVVDEIAMSRGMGCDIENLLAVSENPTHKLEIWIFERNYGKKSHNH